MNSQERGIYDQTFTSFIFGQYWNTDIKPMFLSFVPLQSVVKTLNQIMVQIGAGSSLDRHNVWSLFCWHCLEYRSCTGSMSFCVPWVLSEILEMPRHIFNYHCHRFQKKHNCHGKGLWSGVALSLIWGFEESWAAWPGGAVMQYLEQWHQKGF